MNAQLPPTLCGRAKAAARTHLLHAFNRNANVIQGETLPDPAKDDSFLPYHDNKGFWTFLESVH